MQFDIDTERYSETYKCIETILNSRNTSLKECVENACKCNETINDVLYEVQGCLLRNKTEIFDLYNALLKDGLIDFETYQTPGDTTRNMLKEVLEDILLFW